MKRHCSRTLPAVVAAALVFTACGGDDDVASDDGDPIDAATEQPDDSGLRAPTPIEIAAGGGGDRAAADSAAAEGATTDMMIAPVPWVTEYVVGEGMPALPTDDTGYVYDGGTDVTTEQVAQLAAAVGVTGEPVRTDDGDNVVWRVGPDDGSAPSLWVYDDAQLSWNYNSAWADTEPRTSCVVAFDSDGNEIGECPEPEPPVGVPSGEEAEQRARDLLAAIGVDSASLEFETFADEWFASVTATDTTDPRSGFRAWNIGFGAEGVMQYAGGALATPEAVGPYPLVDLDTALARLTDGSGGYGGYGGPAVDTAVAIAEPAPVDVPEGDVAGGESGEAIPVEPLPVESMPVESLPAADPEPVVVTLVDVRADLWWAWDVDGSVWLLPAYRFIDSEGGSTTVPAVTDEFMIRVEPPVVIDEPLPSPEPLPVETAPPVDIIDTIPPAEPTSPSDTSPILEDPKSPPASLPTESIPVVPTDDVQRLVGLSLEDFTAELAAMKLVVRVVVLDGEPQAGTTDLRADRVNVAVENGIVVSIESIG